ncbi:MAG: hypothetical protein K6D95_03335 [Treponema sp.]|nr:hypothetical protein [Treponema sp.]
MKKITVLITIQILLIAGLFAQEVFSEKLDGPVGIEASNHSYLTEEAVGSEITVTGLLSVNNKKSFVLKENPDSKSAVTFTLVVKRCSLKRKLRKLDGQMVKVTGRVTAADKTWSKSMKVKKVE